MYERAYQSKLLNQKKGSGVKKIGRKRIYFICIGISIVFFAITIGILHSAFFRVTVISVRGAEIVDTTELVEFTKKQTQEMYFSFFPKNNIVLFPIKTLEKIIPASFPRIEKVRIVRRGIHKIELQVSEYESKYVWCVSEQITPCLFVDTKGVAFAEAPVFSGDTYPKLYGGIKKELPFSPYPLVFLQTIDTISTQLRSMNMYPTAFHVVSERELRVVCLFEGESLALIVDPTMNVANALDHLYTTVRTPAFMQQFRETPYALEYIDMRFENKVIYKFQ